ncbi:MAG: class I SAM-dependent methyltransferase [Undibacterium sp.]|nr:class I SAM-dependent methyltransferase [Undibacterium sp.]
MKTVLGESLNRSAVEVQIDQRLYALQNELLPQMGPHWNLHANLFVKRTSLSRILYFNRLYSLLLNVPGVICEFGVQWGASLALLANLRAMYEPYNYSRKIIGFDTFSGFDTVDQKDGSEVAQGDYASTHLFEEKLEEIMQLHEGLAPIAHIKKFELVKGNASVTTPEWLAANPHAVISMAIFDMDVYQPTKDVLACILPRLVKGSVLVFDELNCAKFPGETLALTEVLGLNNLRLQRDPHQPFCAWAVWE